MELGNINFNDPNSLAMVMMQAFATAEPCPICQQPVVFAQQVAVRSDGGMAHSCAWELLSSPEATEERSQALDIATEQARERLAEMRRMVADADRRSAIVEDEQAEAFASEIPDNLDGLGA